MRTFILVAALLLQAFYTPVVFADRSNVRAGVPHIKMVSQDITKDGVQGKANVEVISFLPRNSAEYKEAMAYTIKQMEAAAKAERKIVLVSAEGENKEAGLVEDSEKIVREVAKTAKSNDSEVRVVRAKVPSRVSEGIKERLQGAKDLLYKHERVSLSLLRATVNGTVVSLGLVLNAGLPLSAALPVGILTGALSGAVQYFNPQFQRLIDGNPEKNERLLESGRVGRLRVKSAQLFRWFATEVALYSLIKGVGAGVGVPYGGFGTEALSVLKSSIMATGSQGLWDATIASETREDLSRNEGNSEARRRIQFRSNLLTFGISMFSVFGGVLTLVGSSMGGWTLGILAATGVAYTVRSWKKRRNNGGGQVAGRFNLGIGRCRSVFQ